MFLKNLIKNCVYFFINFLPYQEGAVILMYHSVADNNVFFTVKTKNFAKQMKYLKDKKYNIINLKELINLLELNNNLPKKTVVLTFDDGYQDNYNNAFPILKKYNFPATIFLVTGLVNREINNSQNIPLKILNWEQIKEMHQSELIDFQPHTVNHKDLNEKEIIDSKKEIEEKLNKKCNFFAYPRGLYNNEIIDILKKHGLKAALTTDSGLIDSNLDLFKLLRKSINMETNMVQFKGKLKFDFKLFK